MLAACAAPAIVRAESLMRIAPQIILPQTFMQLGGSRIITLQDLTAARIAKAVDWIILTGGMLPEGSSVGEIYVPTTKNHNSNH